MGKSHQAFEASWSLYDYDDTNSWYDVVVSWLFANDLDINNLPCDRYNYKTYKTLISQEDCNKVKRQEMWQIYTRHQWVNPLEWLQFKMLY